MGPPLYVRSVDRNVGMWRVTMYVCVYIYISIGPNSVIKYIINK